MSGDVNTVLLVVVGLLGAGYFLLPRLRGTSGAPARADDLALAVQRANDDARKLIEQAKADGEAAAERVRRETDNLARREEDVRRLAEDGRREAERLRKEAVLEAKELSLRGAELAKEEAAKIAAEQGKLSAAREERAARREEIAREKEEALAQTELDLAKREATVKVKESNVGELRAEAARLVSEHRAKLEAVAGVSGEQVRRELMEEFFDEARRAAARESKAIEDLAHEEAEKRAKRIIGLAIQRYAGEHVQERAVISIHLPNDDMKGRIIGREGRNIRALQELCGVDFIVDDTPETIVISGFDPVRREIARITIEKLIQDGRIHPTRIEEVVKKAEEEVSRSGGEAGEAALVELGLTRVHPELVKLLGRLRFRYSYAQNVLKHSVECGFLAGLMAAELGQDEKLARRAGLLHDIGKAVMPTQVLNKPGKLDDGEFEIIRTHPVRGYELLKEGGSASDVALDVCLHHHEKFDGSGYPHGLAGDAIQLFARMGAVCDVYDAITSDRPYKAGWDPAESVARMAQWTGHFDPAVFSAFVASVGIYPVGSLVVLESKRIAVVVEQRAGALTKPVVKAFFSQRSKMPISPVLIDLSAQGCTDRISARQDTAGWNEREAAILWAGEAVPKGYKATKGSSVKRR